MGTPSVRSAYDGYAASETEGYLWGLFLKIVFFSSSTSTSSGALRRLLTLCASGHTRQVLGHLEEGVLFPGQRRTHSLEESLSLLQAQPNSTRAPTRRLEGSEAQSTKKTSRRGKFGDGPAMRKVLIAQE